MAEYIEREALLKHAHIGMTRVSDTEWQKGYWDGVDDMAEYIREQPAADVTEVKHGKWMDNRNGTFACSVCGGKASKMDYCGNCGAMMDGEENEKKVMEYICYRCIERKLNGYVEAVSVPEIAYNLNYSQNFTRNIVKKLKEKELITSVCESAFDECKDKYVIVRGYKPTHKGKQTESYKKALYELTE